MYYTIFPELNELMLQKRASNEDLAAQAGVATSTVARARTGGRLTIHNKVLLEQTLEERQFDYGKRGPKGPWKYRKEI
jgi:DNA-binding Xre family transcriptional regulator